jgi:hypothetical protein
VSIARSVRVKGALNCPTSGWSAIEAIAVRRFIDAPPPEYRTLSESTFVRVSLAEMLPTIALSDLIQELVGLGVRVLAP